MKTGVGTAMQSHNVVSSDLQHSRRDQVRVEGGTDPHCPFLSAESSVIFEGQNGGGQTGDHADG